MNNNIVAIEAGALQTLFDNAEIDLMSDAFDTPADEQKVRQAVAAAEEALDGENGAVAVSRKHAEVALRELNTLIRETEGSNGGEEHLTPLARVMIRLKDNAHGAFTPGAEAAYSTAIEIVNDVADETGAETAEVDPLQDDIFQARDELAEATGLPREYV